MWCDMEREEMISRLKAGEKPIDLSIQKWIDIRDGKGEDFSEKNCACCHTLDDCPDCPIEQYQRKHSEFNEEEEFDMCSYMDDENASEYINFMRKVRRWMIKEGRY